MVKQRGQKEEGSHHTIGFNESRGPRIARGAQNFVNRGGRGEYRGGNSEYRGNYRGNNNYRGGFNKSATMAPREDYQQQEQE